MSEYMAGKKLNVIHRNKWSKRKTPKFKLEIKRGELYSQFKPVIKPTWIVEDLAEFLPVRESGLGIKNEKNNRVTLPETFVQNVPGCFALINKSTEEVLYVERTVKLRAGIQVFFQRWEGGVKTWEDAYLCAWFCPRPHNELLKTMLIIYYETGQIDIRHGDIAGSVESKTV